MDMSRFSLFHRLQRMQFLVILMNLFALFPWSKCLRQINGKMRNDIFTGSWKTQLMRLSVVDSNVETRSNLHHAKTCRAILKPGKSRLFKSGNPIIFGGAVERVVGHVEAGQEIYVYDHRENVIGRGFYNPHSQYRVRMICGQHEQDLFGLSLHALISARIRYAKELRKQVHLPNASNSVYRLINGEGSEFLLHMIIIISVVILAVHLIQGISSAVSSWMCSTQL